MAYVQSTLISGVRLYLGDVDVNTLPDSVIIYFADIHDANPSYTGIQEAILWKTTLSCLDYLRASSTTSSGGTSAKYTRKEKVGDVEVTETTDNSSTSSTSNSYDDLYDLYYASPEKFGYIVTPVSSSGKPVTGAVWVTGTSSKPNLGWIKSCTPAGRGFTAYSFPTRDYATVKNVTSTVTYPSAVTPTTPTSEVLSEEIIQSSHGFEVKDIVHFNGTGWALSIADSSGESVAGAIVSKVIDSNTFEVTSVGEVVIEDHGWVVGDYYWLSQTLGGEVTDVTPTSGLAQVLFEVRSADMIFMQIGDVFDLG